MKGRANWSIVERLIGLVMLAAFVALRAIDPAPLETARLQVFDVYQRALPRAPQSYPVVIVDIDEKSLKSVGQWPWPRDVVAQLVNKAAAMGARAVGFDVLFAEPDRLSPGRIAQTVDFLDPETRRLLADLPTNDRLLANAFKTIPVVVGRAGTLDPNKPANPPKVSGGGVGTIGGDPRPFLVGFPGVTYNVDVLEEGAAGRGLFSIRPERDGVIRRVATVMDAGGEMMPSLTIEMLRVANASGTMLLRMDKAGVQNITVGKRRVETDRNAQLWLHYSGRDPKRYVSATDLLDGKVSAERIRGKYVLVGTSAAGLFDLRATPIDRVMPGVEIHAQKLESILTGDLLTRPNYALGAEVSLAIAVGLIIIYLAPKMGALLVLILGAGLAALLGGMSWVMFAQHKILLDVAFPVVSSFLIFVVLSYINYFREEMRRTRIRDAFSQYLSPDLVSQLTQEPDRLVLGGETRELTILFSDVRGFTSIAESYRDSPEDLTRLMNRLLTPLSNAIIERQGTIDKYMGDAVMAFWNAPLDVPEHADSGCASALQMMREMADLNRELEEEADRAGRAHRELNVGIGLSTGSGVVGNMGSDLRFDYSVLGDSVNLASRLEGLTSQLGVAILISNATAMAIGDKFATLEVDLVRVKGKLEPERVHTLVGDQAVAATPGFQSFREGLNEAVSAYREQRWSASRDAFEAIAPRAALYGLAGLFAVYARRIDTFEAMPPAKDWQGVFDAEKK